MAHARIFEMDRPLSWKKIKQLYPGQWVELVDCSWEDCERYPSRGTVRVHARTRQQFHSLAAVSPVDNAAWVYVPEPNEKDSNICFSNFVEFCHENSKVR